MFRAINWIYLPILLAKAIVGLVITLSVILVATMPIWIGLGIVGLI